MGGVAAVVGASGYAGGELLRLLAGHPVLDVGPLVAGGAAGQRLGAVHPRLRSLADRPLLALDSGALREADVVFLALPHGQAEAVSATLAPGQLVIDLSGDHRLRDETTWDRFYGSGPMAAPWIYGLPELADRTALAAARRIANPGCYATAILLALAPLLSAGHASGDDVVVVAASGTTGAGRQPAHRLLASEVMGGLTAYKVGGTHQHVPEIRQHLAMSGAGDIRLSLTPLLAPMTRGILATCTAPVAPGSDLTAVRRCLTERYADEPFVRILAEGEWPHTAATAGSNTCHLQVAVDEDAARVVVVAALDNLGKGAAGQALQNANLALGLPETAGLPIDGTLP